MTAAPKPPARAGTARPFKRARQRKSRLGLFFASLVIVLIAADVVALTLARPHVTGDKLDITTFITEVNRQRVRDARILDVDSYVVGHYVRPDTSIAEFNVPLTSGLQSRILFDTLVPNEIKTSVDQQSRKRLATLATQMLPALILILVFVYLILSYRRSSGPFGRKGSGARRIKAEETTVSFADVAGQESAITELREIKEFLADPERFLALGATVPKGILLFGPPGCGKTMLAKALAAEAEASFFSISGSDFIEMFVGVGASRVRDLFREARENAPAIVFIDELDSIGAARAGQGEHDQALNQILAEMDGFSTTDGIVVLAATNRPDVLDAALLRPGRFDRTIGLERPGEEARLAILKVHGLNKTLAGDVDLAPLAHRAVGLTGADLANVMNEGALLAAREGKDAVTQVELEAALDRTLEAPERQRRLSQRDKSIAKRFGPGEERITFADVAGQAEAIEELSELKDFLTDPERYSALGARIPKGVLLYGPPGCGKTMLARALAAEANAAFFSVAASEFVQTLVGLGAARVRDVFAEAKSMPPAIIFIDELDSVGRARGGTGRTQSHGEADQTLNQILAEMDGFNPSAGLIVLGATNRPDMLDPALLRPGRFDRTVGLALPDEAGRLAILAVHARDKVLDDTVDLAGVAGRAIGLTGADMASVMNEAALLAARGSLPAITGEVVDQALQRILSAPERQRRLSLRGRSVAKRSTGGAGGEERVTFADVAGIDDVVEELTEVRDFLADPSRYARLGARAPRGVLLSGPPGCGKTLVARAVAGEANAAFFSVSATEFVEVFVGEGAARVRDLFAEAKSIAPSIVFIDEIDAVGTRRGGGGGAGGDGTREHDQTLNQILVELDGFEASTAVTVIAATNRPDMLDAALVRPGRFDRRIAVSLPDRKGRRQILGLYATRRPLGADVDLDRVAALTQGFSGADLENIVNEAALLATREDLATVPMRLVDEALDRARMGLASRGEIMTPAERRVVAYHEAGHALVGLLLPEASPPHKLTIVPRAGILGHSTHVDTHDRVFFTRSGLIDEMAVALGGVTAEKLVVGNIGSGSSADLARVDQIARRMVCEMGMSSLGNTVFGDYRHSEEAVRAIEVEVRALVEEASERARVTLAAVLPGLDRVVEQLMERETLTAAELESLVGPSGGNGNGSTPNVGPV